MNCKLIFRFRQPQTKTTSGMCVPTGECKVWLWAKVTAPNEREIYPRKYPSMPVRFRRPTRFEHGGYYNSQGNFPSPTTILKKNKSLKSLKNEAHVKQRGNAVSSRRPSSFTAVSIASCERDAWELANITLDLINSWPSLFFIAAFKKNKSIAFQSEICIGTK